MPRSIDWLVKIRQYKKFVEQASMNTFDIFDLFSMKNNFIECASTEERRKEENNEWNEMDKTEGQGF